MTSLSSTVAVDRWLGLVGRDGEELSESKVRTFRRYLLLALAVEFWELIGYWRFQPLFGVHLAVAILAIAVCAWGWVHRRGRGATVAMLVLVLVDQSMAFPENANHQYLYVILLCLMVFFDPDVVEERVTLLQCLRWLAVIGLAWAGLQKVLYGYYFGGEFLAYAIAQTSRFADLFGWLIPPEELVRLQELRPGPGAGPYRVESVGFILVSNLAYLLEIAVAVMLIVPRLRRLAFLAAIGYVIAIELGARELFFGGLMINLLLLFASRDLNRKCLPLFVLLYAYVLAMVFGILPRWSFS